jgi:hypothetical protein
MYRIAERKKKITLKINYHQEIIFSFMMHIFYYYDLKKNNKVKNIPNSVSHDLN